MSNINLNLATEDSKSKNKTSLGGPIFISVTILILVLVLYGGLIFYGKKIDSDIEKAMKDHEAGNAQFLSNNANEILDFSNRSKEAESLLSASDSGSEILKELEKTVLPSVYLESFKYDEKTETVDLSCVGDNFNTVAKQVLSFKQSNYFSSVTPGEAIIDEKTNGKLVFQIKLKIK